MKEKTENYEPVDLCSCYEPVFELPDDLVEEWRKLWQEKHGTEPEPTPENKAFYGIEPDGEVYFYFGSTRIKVTEHFSDSDRSVGDLIENVIKYTAGNCPTEKLTNR